MTKTTKDSVNNLADVLPFRSYSKKRNSHSPQKANPNFNRHGQTVGELAAIEVAEGAIGLLCLEVARKGKNNITNGNVTIGAAELVVGVLGAVVMTTGIAFVETDRSCLASQAK